VDGLDLVRLELQRPRNIWRFPACEQTMAVHGTAGADGPWPQILQLIASLGPAAAWTLHDLRIAAGDGAPFSAVLRASVMATAPSGVALQPLAADARLLFPVNDAIAALSQLANRVPPALAAALAAPLQATALPNGLCAHFLTAPLADGVELPDAVAAMAAQWSSAAVARPHGGPSRLLSLHDREVAGPLPAGIDAMATVWRVPQATDGPSLLALSRACVAAIQ
jgi:hypothetical protein